MRSRSLAALTTLAVSAWLAGCRPSSAASERVTPEPPTSAGAMRRGDRTPLDPCRAQDVQIGHAQSIRACAEPTRFIFWNGQACSLETNHCEMLSCHGSDCAHVFATLDDCQRAYAACMAR